MFKILQALKSLKAHNEVLKSGAECKKLKGFGDKLCAQIEKKLSEHYGPTYVPVAFTSTVSSVSKNQTKINSLLSVRKRNISTPNRSSPVKKVSRLQRYIPAQGSSGFAILISLLRYEVEYSTNRVNRKDLEDMCKQYTSSMTVYNQRYSGWNTMKTLLNRDLVSKTESRYSYYSLTEEGRKLAKNLAMACPTFKGKFNLNLNLLNNI